VQFSLVAVRLIPSPQPRGEHSQEPLAVWMVRVWESEPPAGAEPLEWFGRNSPSACVGALGGNKLRMLLARE
jgi:hypothetical protein